MSCDETAFLGVLLPALLVPEFMSRRMAGHWLVQVPFGLAFAA